MEIKTSGMHCKSCEILLSEVISELQGTKSVRADYKTGILVVEGEVSLENVKTVVEKEGYKVIG